MFFSVICADKPHFIMILTYFSIPKNLASKHRLIECLKHYFAKSASFLLVSARK